MKREIGVYGGSFDPPHIAHVLCAAYVLSALELERLLIVPTYSHALEKTADADFEARVDMMRLASKHLCGVEVVDVEAHLPRPSRTLTTLVSLSETYSDARLRLVIGSDILAETDRWHRWDDIVALAPPVVIRREGFPVTQPPGGCTVLPATLPLIESSALRSTLATAPGHSKHFSGAESLCGHIPQSVLRYINEHGLYAG